MYKFGFIGTGNMGGAIAEAVARSESPKNIIVSNRTREKAEILAEKLGCTVGDNDDVAEKAKYIFLGVKPQMLENLLISIKDKLKDRKDRFVLVTMAAAVTMEKICSLLGENYPVIRIMPNTPVSIGMGTTVYCVNNSVSRDEKEEFVFAMSKSGVTEETDEKLIDAASAVSGCGPAFVYMFAQSMADGAVKCGLTRALAIKLAAQTIMGAGAMIIETERHPESLKDDVCSPGGTTIEGVEALEKGGMRAAVIDAVCSSYNKNKKL